MLPTRGCALLLGELPISGGLTQKMNPASGEDKNAAHKLIEAKTPNSKDNSIQFN